MKFITLTHLKQWADTRECQSLLPELVRRLICASVKQLDRMYPGLEGLALSMSCLRDSVGDYKVD